MILIPKNVRAVSMAVATGIFILWGAGCSESTSPRTGTQPPQLLATTSIWADITSSVVCGEYVPSLIPIGSDPHTWEPSIATRADIDGAKVIIANGLNLESGLSDLLKTADSDGKTVVEMTDVVDLIAIGSHSGDSEGEHQEDEHSDEEDEHSDEEDEHSDEVDDHDHGSQFDAHIWLDPTRVIEAIPAIVNAAVVAGFDLSTITPCAEQYISSLQTTDREIDELLSSLSDHQRIIVTNHDSLGYFAERYDLSVIGTVLPGSDTSVEANAADLVELSNTLVELGIATIFTDAESTDVDSRALADRLDIDIVPLLTSSLTSGVDSGGSYLDLMLNNAQAISDALNKQTHRP